MNTKNKDDEPSNLDIGTLSGHYRQGECRCPEGQKPVAVSSRFCMVAFSAMKNGRYAKSWSPITWWGCAGPWTQPLLQLTLGGLRFAS